MRARLIPTFLVQSIPLMLPSPHVILNQTLSFVHRAPPLWASQASLHKSLVLIAPCPVWASMQGCPYQGISPRVQTQGVEPHTQIAPCPVWASMQGCPYQGISHRVQTQGAEPHTLIAPCPVWVGQLLGVPLPGYLTQGADTGCRASHTNSTLPSLGRLAARGAPTRVSHTGCRHRVQSLTHRQHPAKSGQASSQGCPYQGISHKVQTQGVEPHTQIAPCQVWVGQQLGVPLPGYLTQGADTGCRASHTDSTLPSLGRLAARGAPTRVSHTRCRHRVQSLTHRQHPAQSGQASCQGCPYQGISHRVQTQGVEPHTQIAPCQVWVGQLLGVPLPGYLTQGADTGCRASHTDSTLPSLGRPAARGAPTRVSHTGCRHRVQSLTHRQHPAKSGQACRGAPTRVSHTGCRHRVQSLTHRQHPAKSGQASCQGCPYQGISHRVQTQGVEPHTQIAPCPVWTGLQGCPYQGISHRMQTQGAEPHTQIAPCQVWTGLQGCPYQGISHKVQTQGVEPHTQIAPCQVWTGLQGCPYQGISHRVQTQGVEPHTQIAPCQVWASMQGISHRMQTQGAEPHTLIAPCPVWVGQQLGVPLPGYLTQGADTGCRASHTESTLPSLDRPAGVPLPGYLTQGADTGCRASHTDSTLPSLGRPAARGAPTRVSHTGCRHRVQSLTHRQHPAKSGPACRGAPTRVSHTRCRHRVQSLTHRQHPAKSGQASCQGCPYQGISHRVQTQGVEPHTQIAPCQVWVGQQLGVPLPGYLTQGADTGCRASHTDSTLPSLGRPAARGAPTRVSHTGCRHRVQSLTHRQHPAKSGQASCQGCPYQGISHRVQTQGVEPHTLIAPCQVWVGQLLGVPLPGYLTQGADTGCRASHTNSTLPSLGRLAARGAPTKVSHTGCRHRVQSLTHRQHPAQPGQASSQGCPYQGISPRVQTQGVEPHTLIAPCQVWVGQLLGVPLPGYLTPCADTGCRASHTESTLPSLGQHAGVPLPRYLTQGAEPHRVSLSLTSHVQPFYILTFPKLSYFRQNTSIKGFLKSI